ncbi:GNAT family N-acetyltransferase [Pseudoalteromonas sp. JBTF-M23]|uniref:GNAT family N-acetyltransferase n=1 Tax=Pseudoalteromonas caenipelagi TaxID=2726988 RepID=A0A849VDK0_9GAMM|nr:GNAT family N-acetyltransferase [Pseudoalteromonas caenipelagi]NOU51472.1 GNAT family N-acetyltransferase [Pseudoalteromonas caenipelagi]
MTIGIRKAAVSDAAAISQLITTLTEKYVCPTCEDSAGDILRSSMSVQRVTSYLSSNYLYMVATTENNEIVGVAGIKDNCHLYHLFVSDDYQGLGLSRRLWECVKQQALNNGNTGRFTVNSAINAEDVYLRFGFKRLEGVRNRQGVLDIPMVLENL